MTVGVFAMISLIFMSVVLGASISVRGDGDLKLFSGDPPKPEVRDAIVSDDLNCWLSSSLAVLAYRSPDTLTKDVFEGSEINKKTGLVKVKLYDKDIQAQEHEVNVFGSQVTRINWENQEFDEIEGTPRWVLAVKNAVRNMTIEGKDMGNDDLFNKGAGEWAMRLLTGKQYKVGDKPESVEKLGQLFDKSTNPESGFPILFLTNYFIDHQYSIKLKRATYYAVLEVEKDGDKINHSRQSIWLKDSKKVKTYNPRAGKQEHNFELRQELLDDINSVVVPV